MMRVLIVDDEPLAREKVLTSLSGEADVEVVGQCATGKDAVAAIKEKRPDLVFLDVQMPGMGGFEVLQGLDRGEIPLVIFVTAYDQHALKAFEVHALDYLLKPFRQSRFKETLAHAREALAGRHAAEQTQKLLTLLRQPSPQPERLTRLPVKDGDRVIFVKVDSVDYIESAGNYVVVHAGKDNHVVRETLSALEEKLGPKQFLRISRSTLVNVDRIKELQPLFKGEHAVLLQNGKQLTMTRGLREVQERLKFS